MDDIFGILNYRDRDRDRDRDRNNSIPTPISIPIWEVQTIYHNL